jgi:glycosyltransferase involved in cell wall biosynthesis
MVMASIASGQMPSRMVYLLSATGNPLYDGRYRLYSRYQTSGQHSFIFDLFRAASRRGLSIDLLIEGLDDFSLTAPLEPYCNIFDVATVPSFAETDFALIDEVSERLLEVLPVEVPAFCVVHDAATNYSPAMQRRCRGFLCMTEAALRYQARSIVAEKLMLIRQGVDLERFRPRLPPSRSSRCPRVLVSSRLDEEKQPTMLSVIDQLVRSNARVTVLGPGDAFWQLSDEYGAQITLIDHIPCHSIHHFLPDFDVVVASGRGAMEALACGIPTLCAGFAYAGLITAQNLSRLLETNLTGYGFGTDGSRVSEDVERALLVDGVTCRRLAEAHCSVDRYLDQLLCVVAASERIAPQRSGYDSLASD